MHHYRFVNVTFSRQLFAHFWVESLTFSTHAALNWKYQWAKGSLFDLHNVLVIVTLFLLFRGLYNLLCWIVNVDPQAHVNLLLANHIVILHCPKTVVLWDQTRFPPLEAPITKSIVPFVGLFHSLLLIFCKWIFYAL